MKKKKKVILLGIGFLSIAILAVAIALHLNGATRVAIGFAIITSPSVTILSVLYRTSIPPIVEA